MSEVDAERQSQSCVPLTDDEISFDNARRELQTLISSVSSQALNSSSLGVMQPHELLTYEEIQRQKHTVANPRAKVAAERRLLTLRRLSSKVNNKRMPSSLRDSTGHQVQDQSRWGHLVHEHFQKKIIGCDDAQDPQTTRRIWRTRVRYAVQRGFSPEILSYKEFQEAMTMVKPDVATGRDNVPGSILRFLPEITQTRLYYAVVERLAGREDAHIKDWAEFDVCLVPKKGDISYIDRWRPISLVPTLYKLYEICMWKVLDKELKPLPSQLFGFRSGRQCLDNVSFLVESLRKAEEWNEKLFVISMDVASAFDSVRVDILGDVLLQRGASAFSAAAVVRENLELRCRPCLGHIPCDSLSLDVGLRQGGPRTPSGWNHLVAFLVEELLQLWSTRSPAVCWAPEWKPFEILVWADNIFFVTSSIIEANRRAQDIAHVFGKKKLLFNSDSLEILPSNAAAEDKTPISLNEEMTFKWVQVLVALGCHINSTGSTETWIKGLLTEGRKMFAKLKPMLCCPKKIPEEERLKAFYTTVVLCVLWGAGCWCPSTNAQQLLSIQENRWLLTMLGGRKNPETDWVIWMRETKRKAHARRSELNLPALWHRALAAMHGWAGHLARTQDSHPGAAAILYKHVEWWEIMKSTRLGARDQTWRHHKKNWVRGFEHALSAILGLGWWSEATKCSRKSWREGKFAFVSEAIRHWGGPKLTNKRYTLESLAPATDENFT